MSRQAKPVDIDQALTDGPILFQFSGQREHIVVVAEPRFERVQSRRISLHASATGLEKPQGIPELLDLLPQLVKVRRILAPLRAPQRFVADPKGALDARRQRLEVTMLWPPLFDLRLQATQVALDSLPFMVFASRPSRLHPSLLQSPTQTSKARNTDERRIHDLQLVENLDIRRAVTNLRQNAVRSPPTFIEPADALRPIGLQETGNRRRLLQALPCLVHCLVGGLSVALQLFPRGPQLFSCQAPQAMCD